MVSLLATICPPLTTSVSPVVPVRAALQSTGEGAPPEVVPRVHAEGEEEDPARVGRRHLGPALQDVQRPRVQGDEGRVQEVRFPPPAAVILPIEISHRYASLYFCVAVEHEDNELISLEIIHRYVELLDKYFGSVSGVLNYQAVHFLPPFHSGQSSHFLCTGLRAGHYIQL